MTVKCTKGTSRSYINCITYKVKNAKFASVNNSGIVRGKKTGNTTITVKATLKSGLTKIFVTKVKVEK